MNIYELLRHLINSTTWAHEKQKTDALSCVKTLEETQAFGTLATIMKPPAHDHEWQWSDAQIYDKETEVYYRFHICQICGIDKGDRTPRNKYSYNLYPSRY